MNYLADGTMMCLTKTIGERTPNVLILYTMLFVQEAH
jgi:hypothetical protein